MKVSDILMGVVGLVILTGVMLFVKSKHENDPIVKRPPGVPKDAGHYGVSDDWIRCLNTAEPTIFDCEIYEKESGLLIAKGSYVAPQSPLLPLIIQSREHESIAVKDQTGHIFLLRPKL